MVLEPQEELMKKFQSVPKIQVIEKYTPIEESDILTSFFISGSGYYFH